MFKIKYNEDKSKVFIAFLSYELGGYSAIYDININELYFIEEKASQSYIGSSIRSLNLYYFERTEQFIIIFRDNEKTFKLV